MNFENINIWCWIIPLLVGIICGILGYFIGNNGSATIDHSEEITLLRNRNTKLQADLDDCRKKDSQKVNLAASTASFTAGTAANTITFDANEAKSVFGKTVKQDDLKVVEGIGPKIEGMFRESGIKTWKALSEASVADCQKVLDKGGKQYKVHDPASWPMQAKMCYENKWRELAKWQEEHKHGKL